MQTHARPRGFTIIELMMTVLVASLLLGLAVPSFMQTIRGNRLIGQANELVGALNFTRSEALKRAESVTICSSNDNTTCLGSRNWSSGWIIFVDTNANGVLDGGETALQAAPQVATEFTLNATARAFVRYTATGSAGSGAEIFTLLRPTCTGPNARRISITAVGRVNTQTVACP
jgi:type IV fimbrial biogenesis protein FimT